MVRSPRLDVPSRFHHIFNRAAKRQVLFADRRDYRYFLMLVACAVRRGELVVHSYCLMSTHFHMLACSPDGRTSYTMMRIQNAYARYYNRRNRQDGSVFRGRFGSRPVLSLLYYVTLLRYIAFNSSQAGLADDPFQFPYSSTRHFTGERCPKWFDREGVASRMGWPVSESETLSRYAGLLGTQLTAGELAFIEKRMTHPRQAEDALDELYRAPPPFLADWMARKTKAAGGRSPWTPVAGEQAVMHAVAALEKQRGTWCLRPARKALDGWAILAAGLLHCLACLTTDATGRALRCHGSSASRSIQLHRRLLIADEDYRSVAGEAARAAIDLTFPGATRAHVETMP